MIPIIMTYQNLKSLYNRLIYRDDDYNIDVKIGSDDYSLDFNVCSYISKTCENTKDIYAALISKGTNESNTTCYALTKAKSDYKVHNIRKLHIYIYIHTCGQSIV